jgi:hypothetical protein
MHSFCQWNWKRKEKKRKTEIQVRDWQDEPLSSFPLTLHSISKDLSFPTFLVDFATTG